MSDLISRQDAILMIQRHGVGCFDADEFYPEEAERFVIGMLEKLPSAETEIIYCKDCKHFRRYECMDSLPSEMCDRMQTFYDADVDYCSLTERRTDETN